MIDIDVTLTKERMLSCTDIGDPGWPCVLFFHGAPSSRLRLAYLESAFLAKKVRVVSPDRPGYGESSPQPGRTMSDWAADVSLLADRLGLDRFIVAGHSSGGPYALACAAMAPARIAAAIVLAGVTDMTWPGAWDGYLGSEAGLMRLPTEEDVVTECRAQFGMDGSGFFASSGISFSAPDEKLYADGEVARLLAASRAEAFRQGVTGYAQDVFIQGRPWPFDPGTIVAPVTVAHGELDSVLPLAHSRHTAQSIPVSTLRTFPQHGHFTILAELPVLATQLLAVLR